MIDFYKLLILGQGFLRAVIAIDAFGRCTHILLIVTNGRQGQTVSGLRVFIWLAQGNRCYGHNEFGQVQYIDDSGRLINGGA